MGIQLTLTVNGASVTREVEPQTLLVRVPARDTAPDRHPRRLRHRAVRRLHRARRRPRGEELRDAGGAGRRQPRSPRSKAWRPADGTLHPMQAAFNACHGLQCGFCTPGMVMSAVDLVQNHACSTEEQIRDGLDGNLCRCTGYQNIVKAVRRAPRP